jgi:hypothetical protein
MRAMLQRAAYRLSCIAWDCHKFYFIMFIKFYINYLQGILEALFDSPSVQLLLLLT